MKRRIALRLILFFQWLRICFYKLLSTGQTKGKAIINQPSLMMGDGLIVFENNVKLGYFPSPFFLTGNIHLETRNKRSSIKIGDDTAINNNFVAIAEHKTISIGKRCLIGTNVEISDSDFHGIRISERKFSTYEMAKSVVLEDDIFIGSNVKILKGTVIGCGSVIANGSIVTGKIPCNVIAGGIPAKVLKTIKP